MEDEAQTAATTSYDERLYLRDLQEQRDLAKTYLGAGPVQQLDPVSDACIKAEQEAQEARWQAEQARDRDERNRVLALQLAAGVAGQQGDPGAVIGAAGDFLAFLTGTDKRPH